MSFNYNKLIVNNHLKKGLTIKIKHEGVIVMSLFSTDKIEKEEQQILLEQWKTCVEMANSNSEKKNTPELSSAVLFPS